jgi:RNA polymerase sigma factor (sigma-70 family)
MSTVIQNEQVQAIIISQLKETDINKPVQFLYQNYYEGVLAMIRSKGGNEEDAADIFQETVLTLVDKVKNNQFRGESSVKTFMVSVARNLWLHELRTRGRRNKREVAYFAGADVDEAADERQFNKPATDTMKTIFEAVGDVCTQILTGYYYEDLSMRQLLERFDFENEQVLRNRKSKCMKKLKEILSTNIQLLDQFKTLCLYGTK